MIISLLDGSIWICMGGFHHKIIYDGNVYDRIGACLKRRIESVVQLIWRLVKTRSSMEIIFILTDISAVNELSKMIA